MIVEIEVTLTLQVEVEDVRYVGGGEYEIDWHVVPMCLSQSEWDNLAYQEWDTISNEAIEWYRER